MWGMKICLNVPGHMTMPIYGKQLQKDQEANDLETWYAALGTQVLPMFSCDDPELTLTIFMTVKFVSECFSMGESLYSIEC